MTKNTYKKRYYKQTRPTAKKGLNTWWLWEDRAEDRQDRTNQTVQSLSNDIPFSQMDELPL